MVLSYIDIFEQCDRIVGEHGGGAVKRDQVRRQSALVDSLETNRQSRALFSRKPRLEETNHALLLFTDAHQQDLGLVIFASYCDLVAGNQWNTAPGKKWRTEQSNCRRGNASPRAFTSKGGDCF